ncbi:hypothetical protein GCM10008997_15010 [Halomonas salifodinae]
MTVPTSENRVQYEGNDSATEFDYTFKIFDADDLVVVLTDVDDTETTLVRGSDYSVDGVGDEAGGTVTYPLSGDRLATGETLTILREIPVVQETDLRNQGAYYPETIEDEFDRSRMIDQQQQERLERTLSRTRASDYFDAQGRRITGVGDPIEPSDAVSRQWVYQYLAALESGAVGDTTLVTASGTADQRSLAEWMASLIALGDGLDRRVVYANTIVEMQALVSLVDGQHVSVSEYLPGSGAGGGEFYYSAGTPKSEHDGIGVISPTVPWDGTKPSLGDFQSGVGESDPSGAGVYIAVHPRNNAEFAGIIPGTGDTDTAIFQNLINYCEGNNYPVIYLDSGEYVSDPLSNPSGIQFVGEGAYFSNFSNRVGSSFDRGVAQFSLPPGLSWAPFDTYSINSDGMAEVDFNVRDYALEVEDESLIAVYVDYVNGNDTNNGSVNAPLKTLSAAFSLNSAGVVWMMSDVNYNESTIVIDSSYQKPFVQIKSWSGSPVTIWNGPDPSEISWSVASGTTHTYEATVASGVFGVFDSSILNRHGQYKAFSERSSIADVNANPGSWFFDSGANKLYVRRFSNNPPDGDLRVQSNGGILLQGDRALYLENAEIQSGNPVQAYAENGIKPRLYMSEGGVYYSLNFGVDADGADVFVEDVEAYGNGLDNFNYHVDSSGLLQSNAIEINVNSYGAGSVSPSGPENKNGSSMHDAGNVIRINGEYHSNYGPNVVDTTSGVSLNVGTRAENSIAPTDTQNRNFSVGASGFPGTMYCHGTSSRRSSYDYYSEGVGAALYVADAIDSGRINGNVLQYWPD